MANSLKVIPELLPKVKIALTQQGFPSQTALYQHIGISRATVTKFFTR
jgi:biotin operon repressor